VTKARSIPSFDNLAIIIIRISAFLTLPQKTKKGRNGKKFFQKGGNSGRKTRIGRWHYEKIAILGGLVICS
jgi:hypothetical protein